MYCNKCGKKLNEGDVFCSGCGAKVEVSLPVGEEISFDSVVEPQERRVSAQEESSSFSMEKMNWDLEGYPSDSRRRSRDTGFDWSAVVDSRDRDLADAQERRNVEKIDFSEPAITVEELVQSEIRTPEAQDEEWRAGATVRMDYGRRTDLKNAAEVNDENFKVGHSIFSTSRGFDDGSDVELTSTDFIPPLNREGSIFYTGQNAAVKDDYVATPTHAEKIIPDEDTSAFIADSVDITDAIQPIAPDLPEEEKRYTSEMKRYEDKVGADDYRDDDDYSFDAEAGNGEESGGSIKDKIFAGVSSVFNKLDILGDRDDDDDYDDDDDRYDDDDRDDYDDDDRVAPETEQAERAYEASSRPPRAPREERREQGIMNPIRRYGKKFQTQKNTAMDDFERDIKEASEVGYQTTASKERAGKDKFYTFNQKSEEFKALLDEEYERLRQRIKEETGGSEYDNITFSYKGEEELELPDIEIPGRERKAPVVEEVAEVPEVPEVEEVVEVPEVPEVEAPVVEEVVEVPEVPEVEEVVEVPEEPIVEEVVEVPEVEAPIVEEVVEVPEVPEVEEVVEVPEAPKVEEVVEVPEVPEVLEVEEVVEVPEVEVVEPEVPEFIEVERPEEPAVVIEEPEVIVEEPAVVIEEPEVVAEEPAIVIEAPEAVAEEPVVAQDDFVSTGDAELDEFERRLRALSGEVENLSKGGISAGSSAGTTAAVAGAGVGAAVAAKAAEAKTTDTPVAEAPVAEPTEKAESAEPEQAAIVQDDYDDLPPITRNTVVLNRAEAKEAIKEEDRKLRYGDIFNNDEEETYAEEEKGRNGKLIILDILIVLLAIAVILVAIMVFGSNTAIGQKLNGLLHRGSEQAVEEPADEETTAEDGETEATTEETNTPETPVEETVSPTSAAIIAQASKNTNIGEVAEDTALLFNADTDYGIEGVEYSSVFQDTDWYTDGNGNNVSYLTELVGAAIQYHCQLMDRYNEGSDAVLNMLDASEDLYYDVEAIEPVEGVTHELTKLQIGEVRRDGDNFYMLVRTAKTVSDQEDPIIATKVMKLNTTGSDVVVVDTSEYQ